MGDGSCHSDFLEIIDVKQDSVIYRICGSDRSSMDKYSSDTTFSVKGPVGVRFVSNFSILHDVTTMQKNHRGFKITYALSGVSRL